MWAAVELCLLANHRRRASWLHSSQLDSFPACCRSGVSLVARAWVARYRSAPPFECATLAGPRYCGRCGLSVPGPVSDRAAHRARDVRRLAGRLCVSPACRQRSAAGVLAGDVVDAGGVHGRARVSRLDHEPACGALAILDEWMDRWCAGVVGALRRRASLSGFVGNDRQRVERACLRAVSTLRRIGTSGRAFLRTAPWILSDFS